jgi:hypothetical protein
MRGSIGENKAKIFTGKTAPAGFDPGGEIEGREPTLPIEVLVIGDFSRSALLGRAAIR